MNETGIRVKGLQIVIEEDRVKYAVEGRWHHCTLREFIELLDNHFRPVKQQQARD